jgi:hypothetical protein
MSKAIAQLQLTAEQAWVAYWQAVVTTGYYKFSKSERPEGQNPDGSFKWRPSTEDEKLRDAMGSLHAHVDRIQDLTDLLIEEEA